MSMIHANPEIELIISAAGENAKSLNHEYVTLEHLLHAIIEYKPFNEMLKNFGVDVNRMLDDVNQYLIGNKHIESEFTDAPKKTHALERVFNRALTQVLFSGRQQMQIIDIFISITAETWQLQYRHSRRILR